MTDEVFNLMKYFPESFIKPSGEIILDRKCAMLFTVKGICTKEDIAYKIFEWCSRPIAKGMIYSDCYKNRDYRRSLLLGINNYLKTSFTENDMYIIYDRLGNAVDHEKTVRFVDLGFDIQYLIDDMKKANGGE